MFFLQNNEDIIGYEPADLTVHPPPQNCRGCVNFFRICVYSVPKKNVLSFERSRRDLHYTKLIY